MAEEDSSGRLGKIERFLLTYMVRPSFVPTYSVHARSCALQTYYREKHGIQDRNRRNVAAVVPTREYNSLQVAFTKALQRLEKKGLVETARGGGQSWSAEKQLGAGKQGQDLGYILGISTRMLQAHVCCRRYTTVYGLTRKGSARAYHLAWGWKDEDADLEAF